MHNKAIADRFNAAAGNSIEEHKPAVLSQMDCIHYFVPEAAAVIKIFILFKKFSPRLKSPSLTNCSGLSRALIFHFPFLNPFYFCRGGETGNSSSTCPWLLLLPVHLFQGSARLFVPFQSPNSMEEVV